MVKIYNQAALKVIMFCWRLNVVAGVCRDDDAGIVVVRYAAFRADTYRQGPRRLHSLSKI